MLNKEQRNLAEENIESVIKLFGYDTESDGLKKTPERYVKFLEQFMTREEFKFTTFDKENYDQMIVQKGITFFSLCEHHLAPFFGTATVAYIPDKRIVGLSKLARCVRYYASGLQNQERITMKTADRLEDELKPKGVAVILEARHLCMEMRGVKTSGAATVTSEMIGVFRDEAETRNELLNFIKE